MRIRVIILVIATLAFNIEEGHSQCVLEKYKSRQQRGEDTTITYKHDTTT